MPFRGKQNLIILPTYNERRNLESIVKAIWNVLPETHILIVDDNSPDGTQDQVKELQRIYGEDKIVLNARPGKMGLGSAYIDGLKRCKGSHVILMDADLSHHVSLISNFLTCQL